MVCVCSGGRSAILSLYEGCFRLKGCGNYMDTEGMRYSHPGFPLAKLEVSSAMHWMCVPILITGSSQPDFCVCVSTVSLYTDQ